MPADKTTMPSNVKVLLITPAVPEYRYDFFQLLATKVDLSILHSGREIMELDSKFKQIILPMKQWGPVDFFPRSINKLCKNFDIVISEANLRHIDRDLLILNPFRKYKWISWGIGVSASYDKKFDHDTSLDNLRHFIFRRADANIFYSNYPIQRYLRAGFRRQALFVANNTTHVAYDDNAHYKKEKILFLGTLYREKRIYELLKSYKAAYGVVHEIMPLHIIGTGPEYDSIASWISQNKLGGRVKLLGSIFDHSLLGKHVRAAYACISPGQAGLSVLTSMGYGTPYITMRGAITGGEIFNIRNYENGILYDTDGELEGIILDIHHNPDKFIAMGRKAREYYIENRRIEDMAKGFTDAIEYVMSNHE